MEKQICQTPNSSCSASVRLGFWLRALLAYHCVDGRINNGSGWRLEIYPCLFKLLTCSVI
uniref:Uncharacterized protein n=1 Tax=Arundo donax TaxID=35708 RepID=A0A0A8ZQN3_ARUDO